MATTVLIVHVAACAPTSLGRSGCLEVSAEPGPELAHDTERQRSPAASLAKRSCIPKTQCGSMDLSVVWCSAKADGFAGYGSETRGD